MNNIGSGSFFLPTLTLEITYSVTIKTDSATLQWLARITHQVLYWVIVRGIFLPSTQGLLGQTPVASLILIKKKKHQCIFCRCHFVVTMSVLSTLPPLYKVAGIVGRADLLCALFFQLSFLTYCKAFHRGRHLSILNLPLLQNYRYRGCMC